MKNWQGIPTTRFTLGSEVIVPRDNRTLVFSTELLNYIIPFAIQGKSGHYKAWSPYSCNGRKHRCKRISDPVLSNFDTREHFDYNIVSLTSIVMNCSVSSRHVSSLVSSCIANLNQRDMPKQLLTPLRLIAGKNFLLKNNSCELFNLMGMVGKVELISTFTTAVCESWNVSDKYTFDNAGDLKQLSIDQTLSEDNKSD